MTNQIKAIRANRRMTQAELGRAAGLDSTYVSHIETGRYAPRIDTARKLTRALGCGLDDAFPDERTPTGVT